MSIASTPVTTQSGTQSSFRPEIQGLRTIAAILIAIHHIWFGRVSGGVDVFFVVSGFLLTGSLAREVTSTQRIRIAAFWTRIARRIFPAAYVVIGVAIVGTYIWVSRVFWPETYADIRAAATYTANIRFAETSVDYLAQSEFKSPVLHFWAMSIQGQFYLVWPVFLLVAWKIGAFVRIRRSAILPVALTIILVVSFVYSVMRTANSPTEAYYDSFARIWEFALGGLLGITIAKIKVSKNIASLLAWVGLAMFVGTGIFIVDISFPGYIALIPTLGAVMLIISGNAAEVATSNVPMKLLRLPILVKLGDYSYSFFLWHWPILVFGKLYFETDTASALGGIAVMVAALALSIVTVRFVENPFLRRRDGENKLPSFTEMISLIVVIAAVFVSSHRITDNAFAQVSEPVTTTSMPTDDDGDPSTAPTDQIDPADLILTMDEAELFDPANPITPDPLLGGKDLPLPRLEGCVKKLAEELIPKCAFYGTPGRPRIVLLGGSHSLHWFAPIYAIAQKYDLELLALSRPGCRFGTDRGERCDTWLEEVVRTFEKDPPAYIFATATTAREQNEIVGYGFVENWRRMERLGVHVFAIRDNPEFTFNPPACVDENRSDPAQCSMPRSQVLAAVNPATQIVNMPTNVTLLDLTDYLCSSTTCYVVRDNILMYRDKDHVTQTFASFLTPLIDRGLRPIFERDGIVAPKSGS
jgi:peptidoglycan/LPS O-acetylase OafA/YrhL